MRILRTINGATRIAGIDLVQLVRVWPLLVRYFGERSQFFAQRAASEDKSFAVGNLRPCLADRYEHGGVASGHYFHQDLLVARLIYRAGAKRHVDVGSRVDGFVAHVAVFCEVEVLDIRPIQSRAYNITFRAVDIMNPGSDLNDFTDSLSCLHALEHFGLGRYGDPIDYTGHHKGFATLARMVRVGGSFYFSVPISERQRLEFNAHRIFSIPYLLKMFGEFGFEVKGFHYVDDVGNLHETQDHQSEAASNSFGLSHGCGIFELRKRDD